MSNGSFRYVNGTPFAHGGIPSPTPQIVISGEPQDGYVITALGDGTAQWQPQTGSGSGSPTGPAGGDLSGTYPNPTVAQIQGVAISITTPTNGQVLEYNSGTSKWTPTNQVSGVTWADDLAGSTNTAQYVSAISGNAGSGGSIPVNATSLTFATGESNPAINQNSISSTSGQTLTVQAQNASGHQGGNVVLKSGTGTADGYVYIESGSASQSIIFDSFGIYTEVPSGQTISFNVNNSEIANIASGGITIDAFSTGVVHSSSAGLLSSSLIVNADVSSSAAIAVSKLASGTSAQVLLNNSTPSPTWTTLSGNATVSNSGVVTVSESAAVGGITVTGVPSSGQVLTATSSSAADWQTPTTGTITALTGDVTASGSGSVVATVVGLDTTPIVITSLTTGNLLQYNGTDWVNVTPGSLSTVTWANDLVNSSNTHQYVSSLSYSSSSAGGAITINGTGSSLTFANNNTGPVINQASPTATNTPAAGSNLLVQAQAGTNAVSGNSSGGSGGDLLLAAGLGGTKTGSGTAGADGYVSIQTGGTERAHITDTGVTLSSYGTGIAHFSSAGLISSSLVVNADVSSSAAIAVSKLASGTSAQILLNNSTPSPTWVSVSGDISISNTGSTLLQSINGVGITGAYSPTTGNSLVYGGAPLGWYSTALNLAGGSNYVTGALPVANIAAGSNGQVLETVSGVPTWTTIGGTSVTGTGLWYSASGTLNSAAITLTGDVTQGALSGSNVPLTVVDIHGASVPASGSLTTGNVLQVSGSSALTYAAVNLAGGSNYVTGNLPISNVAPSGTDYQILTTNGSGVTAWAALSLNQSAAVSGALPIANLATGTSAQILMSNATPANAWTTMSGDVTIGATGITTVGQLQGSIVLSGTPSSGQVLTATSSTAAHWATPSGGGVTWANDLVNSTSTDQYVSSLSYSSSSAGGTIVINGTGSALQWALGNTAPTFNQATLAATNTPAAGANFLIQAQAGTNAISGNTSGGAGGNLVLSSGAVGIKQGSGTNGAYGQVQLALGGTGFVAASLDYGVTEAGYTTLTLGNTSAVDVAIAFSSATALVDIFQINMGSTSSGSGSNGAAMYISAQSGQNATGASHNGGTGGNLNLSAGAGGTSGSATTGNPGFLVFGNTTRNVVSSLKTSTYTIIPGQDNIIGIGTLTAGITVNLPASPTTGDTYYIKDVNGTVNQYNVTVTPNSGNIDGASTYVMKAAYQSIMLVYTSAEWSIL